MSKASKKQSVLKEPVFVAKNYKVVSAPLKIKIPGSGEITGGPRVLNLSFGLGIPNRAYFILADKNVEVEISSIAYLRQLNDNKEFALIIAKIIQQDMALLTKKVAKTIEVIYSFADRTGSYKIIK